MDTLRRKAGLDSLFRLTWDDVTKCCSKTLPKVVEFPPLKRQPGFPRGREEGKARWAHGRTFSPT
ncbi:hypothetical protein A6R68_10266 [Neotoma lepida]|uniref:Uncharacterized protein n=1 Tax=Neotoma lepida TaxID=56216 RepID=A0A1A6FXD7_NEOLE|nr:hypothetical protein A6R68_10266 [Neotoma lepida]